MTDIDPLNVTSSTVQRLRLIRVLDQPSRAFSAGVLRMTGTIGVH